MQKSDLKTYYKAIFFAFSLTISALIVWYAIDVFFLGFATILLAILLFTIGKWTQKLIHLPYILSLVIALTFLGGLLVLIFWIYSPLIVEQFDLLVTQLPEAATKLRNEIIPYIDQNFSPPESVKNEFSIFNEKVVTRIVSLFSATVGSIIGFAIFMVVGFYLAAIPQRYLSGFLFLIPDKVKQEVWNGLVQMGRLIQFWLLGKIVAMVTIGLLTFIGLQLLNISLAFILGLLAGILAFIPYVGSILAALPAILIAFSYGPLQALYVVILYLGIHVIEGYFITPLIEQKTVFIPPALTIMAQILIYVLVGGLGLALTSPLLVVIISLIATLKRSSKVGDKTHYAHE